MADDASARTARKRPLQFINRHSFPDPISCSPAARRRQRRLPASLPTLKATSVNVGYGRGAIIRCEAGAPARAVILNLPEWPLATRKRPSISLGRMQRTSSLSVYQSSYGLCV